jgi:hypothetical protein
MVNIISAQAAGSISLLGLIEGFSGRITMSYPYISLTPNGFLNAKTIWDNYSFITPLRRIQYSKPFDQFGSQLAIDDQAE